MSMVQERLRIVPEFTPADHDRVHQTLSGKLDRRLSRWRPEQVELELSMKGRDTNQQRVTLECWVSGAPKFVATSSESKLDAALADVRDDLHKQVDRYVTKQESARRR